jgi:hypothetical protein
MSLITVIGRGHSGTRAISHTLYASGVFMGSTLNPSGDKVPPQSMYDACRVFARHVTWRGDLSWDFEPLHTMDIDPEFTSLVQEYLADVLSARGAHCGWKLPETTLVLPWIVRLFPEARYIYLIRDPRDSILGGHITDDLADFGVQYPATDDERQRRAISWKYQYDLVRSTPRPANWLTVRFEDFILKHEETVQRLEEYLDIPLARIIVRPESVGRWRSAEGTFTFDFFRDSMLENGYTEGPE